MEQKEIPAPEEVKVDPLIAKAIDKLIDMMHRIEGLDRFEGQAAMIKKFKNSIRYMSQYKVHVNVAMLILKERKQDFNRALGG